MRSIRNRRWACAFARWRNVRDRRMQIAALASMPVRELHDIGLTESDREMLLADGCKVRRTKPSEAHPAGSLYQLAAVNPAFKDHK